jgi:rare lipoprotein A
MTRHLFATAAAALLLSLAFPSHAQSAAPGASSPAAAAPGAGSDAAAGKVAYYGRKFAGRTTASGERFNPNALTMAHKTLPLGSMVRVTNLKNQKSVVVRVNDRGPTTADRIGDLSQGAAGKLRMLRSGVVDAKLEVVGTAKAHGKKAKKTMA